MMTRPLRSCTSARQQRGAALLLLLTIIVMAASYTLFKRLNGESPAVLQAITDATVLGEARTALVGYALKSSARPGELPCPDTNNDGESDYATACTAYIGRLPWVTLGLGDLRDRDGERLWYALDIAFDGNTPINSDTTASLTLDTNPGQHYAALVFAPGVPLTDGQARPTSQKNNVTRYLEGDNADGDTGYASTLSGDFNDQVIALGDTPLLQAVERRVLGELKSRLDAYYRDKHYYPNPAALNTTVCDTDLSQGHIPITISGSCPGQNDWATALPSWFTDNGWNLLVWYAVAPACGPLTPDCSGSGFLEVINTPAPTDNKQAIVIAAGAVRGGQNRSPAASNLTDLLDDAENNDDTNLEFSRLPVDINNNDQLLIVTP